MFLNFWLIIYEPITMKIIWYNLYLSWMVSMEANYDVGIYWTANLLRKGWSYPESKRFRSTRSLLVLTSDWDFSDSIHSKYRNIFNKSFKLQFTEWHVYVTVSENFLNQRFSQPKTNLKIRWYFTGRSRTAG